MKFTIDTEQKTLFISDNTKLSDAIKLLKKVDKDNWKEYSLVPKVAQIPEPCFIVPYIDPFWNQPYILDPLNPYIITCEMAESDGSTFTIDFNNIEPTTLTVN